MNPRHIALIYKKRLQIELLFKQFKQNFPFKCFLGDNENTINPNLVYLNCKSTIELYTSKN